MWEKKSKRFIRLLYALQNLQSVNMYPEGICIGYMDINLSHRRKLRFSEETDDIKHEIEVCKNFNRICKNIC